MKDRSVRRATRLARLYPRRWREEFPDFVEALAEELVAHPRGAHRDVVRGAIVERFREAGIIPKRPADRPRSGLALVYAALIPFAGLAMGMWSQLGTGLASDSGNTTPVLRASDLLLAVGTFMILLVLPFVLVLVVTEARRGRKGRGSGRAAYRPLVGPGLALVGSLGVLTVAGWEADRSGWYSPAAVALPHQGPGHFLTLWGRGIIATITPAWIHPGLFAHMPTGELIAALLAPVAAATAAGALFRLIVRIPHRVPGPANVLLAASVFGMMFLTVVASGRWLLAHPGQQGLTSLQAHSDQLAPGHTGWVVVLLLAALTAVALVGIRRLLRGQPDEPTGGDPSGRRDIGHLAPSREDRWLPTLERSSGSEGPALRVRRTSSVVPGAWRCA
jgi:hypothetical protein